MSTGVEFAGLDTLVGVVRSAKANANPALMSKVFSVMNDVFTESQKQVPVQFGHLKGSGFISPPEDGEIAIGYGGAAAEYALWVHENLSAHHRPPTKAKYLEDPMKDAGPKLMKMTGDLETALLGQYPQAPSRAASVDAVGAGKLLHPHMSDARVRHAMSTSRAFSSSEIKAALASASAHPGRMTRSRKG